MTARGKETVVLEDAPIARTLFGDTRLAWVWLLLRLYLGWEWIDAAWHKVTDPRWMQTGEALKAYWERAVQIPKPPARPPVAYDWYREFLLALLNGGHYTWFAKVIAVSELVLGVALILGAFTALAAFFGGFMNWNFIMAGSASTNAMLFAIATWLVLAWKTAGWIGLDRWLLPLLGTPWRPGRIFHKIGGSHEIVAHAR